MPEDLLTDEDMGIMAPAGSPPVASKPLPEHDVMGDTDFVEPDEGGTRSVHTLTITPELRKSVLTQGFPQFKRGGRIHSKGKYA